MNRVLILCIVGFLALVVATVLLGDDTEQQFAQGCHGVASCSGTSAGGCAGQSAAGCAGAARGPLRGIFQRRPLRKIFRGCGG